MAKPGLRPVMAHWYGSKGAISPWIVEHLGPHDLYVEPYAGTLAVLLRKPRTKVEIVNDLDGDIVNLYRVVRDCPGELADRIGSTPYARSEFDACRWTYDQPEGDPVERARRFLVRVNQGFSGTWKGSTFSVDYAAGNGQPRAAMWARLPDAVHGVGRRLSGVTIEQRDALELVAATATKPNAVLYLDPPYANDTRQPGAYKTDADDAHHDRLLEIITDESCVARVVLSGYASPRYADALDGWTVRQADVATGGRDGQRSRRVESLWINYPASDDLFSGVVA